MYTLADGSVWQDPPFYWDQLVYPAYVNAHAELFDDRDVEHGTLTRMVGGAVKPGLVLVEGVDMQCSVDACCRAVLQCSRMPR